MNPEQENFEPLRRLLALKRYEQPPPGYFDGFSRQVIARIQAGATVEEENFLERWIAEAAWLRRVWSAFETKPILAGAFGVAVCGLLISGVVYSERTESTAVMALPTSQGADSTLAQIVSPALHPLFEPAALSEPSSTGGLAPAPVRSSLFQEFREMQKPVVQPASFGGFGGN
ncbi:MAG TPA: hypothetical protein VNZ22_05030 [Bacillota bacterium]|nr:hypothetical protein [Bacillota bacterium]